MDGKTRICFYISGVVASLVVTALVIARQGGLSEASEEAFSWLFIFVWVLLPFVILPSIAPLPRRAIFTAVLATMLVWVSSMIVASVSGNDVNFGLIAVLLLSPGLIVLTVLSIERFVRSRGS